MAKTEKASPSPQKSLSARITDRPLPETSRLSDPDVSPVFAAQDPFGDHIAPDGTVIGVDAGDDLAEGGFLIDLPGGKPLRDLFQHDQLFPALHGDGFQPLPVEERFEHLPAVVVLPFPRRVLFDGAFFVEKFSQRQPHDLPI